MNFGPIQTFKNMCIVPVFVPISNGPEYLTLPEALGQKWLIITEVDQSGSVPELKVVNTSEYLILLLDGEELMGAKQNRVLNASILLDKQSKTLLPVSCTEQGRWGYISAAFSYSDAFMSRSVRTDKLRSVTTSLLAGRGHTSDQRKVWANITGLHKTAGTSSSTGAMRDVYVSKHDELKGYIEAFAYIPQQQGSLVFINGEVVGLDLIPRPAAYQTLHSKVVQGYAMDALLRQTKNPSIPSTRETSIFLTEATTCNVSRFKGVGLGDDYRLEGINVVGSALVYQDSLIHLALFKAEKETQEHHMSNLLRRKRFGDRDRG
jgi:hypothetical protein